MIDLYAWGTTNGRRALVMVEESGLPFTLHQINIQKGDQKTPEYGKINPFRKMRCGSSNSITIAAMPRSK